MTHLRRRRRSTRRRRIHRTLVGRRASRVPLRLPVEGDRRQGRPWRVASLSIQTPLLPHRQRTHRCPCGGPSAWPPASCWRGSGSESGGGERGAVRREAGWFRALGFYVSRVAVRTFVGLRKMRPSLASLRMFWPVDGGRRQSPGGRWAAPAGCDAEQGTARPRDTPQRSAPPLLPSPRAGAKCTHGCWPG